MTGFILIQNVWILRELHENVLKPQSLRKTFL